MPIFPLTPQQFSNLKKELKANKKKPGKVLEEIIANPKNSQQLNVIQLALFCLDLNGDLNLAQKLTNSFISAALYPQAFSILLLQHSLLHSKDQKITSPKTPSKTEIAKLLHVDPKTFTRLPNYICIYLINVMRVTVALEIDIEINAFFSKKDGLIYWLDRLEKSDKQLIQDHAFRMLYNILNEFLKKSNDRLKSGKIHWVFTDAVEYAKIVLTLYKDSSKFQQENFDKLAGNYVGYFSKLESPIQRGFFKYLLTLQMDSKSNNCNIWFEHIMNLEIEADKDLLNLTSDFLGNTKILTLLFQAAQGLAVAWRGFKTSSISNTFDLSMLRVFFPKIVKRMLEKSDLIFKTKAQNWNIAIDSAEVEECLECIGVLLYYIESLQKEGLKYFASLHLAKSQLLFIQESNTSLIISCLDGLDDYIDVRLCGLAYNFAASLANRGLNAEAVQFFGRCRSYYTICVQDLPLLVSKLIKPVQGECQCLIALKKYSDCVELISNVMGNLKVDQWLAPNNFKHLQSLVLMSVIAKSKNGNSNFRSISSGFGEWSLEIFEVELKFVLQQGLVDHRFQLLKEASIKAVPPLKKASFLLKLAELDRPHGKSYCQQAMGLIAGLDQDDPLVQSQRAIVLCETSISNNETGNADLLNGLQTWQNLFGHISPYRVELKPQNELKELDCNYLFHYLKQLAEYLRAIADFQMCTFAYGLASRLCNLCPELNQAEESLEIYVALAFAYIELGYSGRAGLSLGIAKSFLSSANSKLAANFYVAYSEYLLSIGNTQKSSEIRARVSIGADIDTLTFLFDSKLSLMCGDIKSSTDSAYTAYQKAMKLLKTSKHHNFAETAIIAEALKALLVLINLLDFQGFPKKIDYYIEQGLKLAEKMNSFVWHGLFSIEKARLHCKRAETNQSRNVISSALKDFESNDELTMFSGKLHLTHGDILLKDSTSAEFAKSEYISAETIVDTGLDPAFFNSFDIGKIQETLLSFTENAMAGKENIDRCDGLENVKGSILCSSSVLNLKAGNFKEAERKLTIVAKLRLSPKEKCLYYLNLSLLRYDQLMKSSASMDKAEVFPDAVLGYPFHSEPLLKRKFCSAAQLNNFKKFGAFLEDAFALLVEHGNPADAQVLSRIIVSIDTFKSFIMQAHSGEELDSCIYHLEYPKSIYHRRKNPQSTLKVETQTEWISRMNSQVWDRLPLDIVVCCINCDPERDILYITRHENGRTFHFKLPVCRLAQREAELNGKGMAFVDAMNEFEDIMVINKETTSSAKYCVEKEERKKWKKTREDLDDRLEKFLNRLESEWLAGFKGLLSSREIPENSSDALLKFKARLEKMLFTYISRCISKKTTISVHEDLCKILVRIGIDPEFEALEDVLYYLLDSFQSRGISIEYDEINIEDMRDDLKDAISLFHKESRMKSQKGAHKHMLIIPDKNLQHLPWESIPVLRGCSVSRMPSLEMLTQYLNLEQTFDRESVFYLLNPSGDLTRTEKKFKALLRGSNGISGRIPTKDEFLSGLTQSEIFLYFGHGGGENYVDVFSIEKMASVPVVLLFGCSSGRLKPCGDYDPHGISLEYLSAGSLGVLGNLWDVTDIDIDRFSDDLMTRWGLFSSTKSNRSSLPESCAIARDACSLKFIVGAAPVFYGLRPKFR